MTDKAVGKLWRLHRGTKNSLYDPVEELIIKLVIERWQRHDKGLTAVLSSFDIDPTTWLKGVKPE